MKNLNIYKYCVLLLMCFTATYSYGQTKSSRNNNDQFYVVVGAFRIENNAIAFVKSLNKNNIKAVYKYHKARDLNYVYTFNSKNAKLAKEQLSQLRKKNSSLDDSWLYFGYLEGKQTLKQEIISKVIKEMNQEPISNDTEEIVEDDVTKEASEEQKIVSSKSQEEENDSINKEVLDPTFKVYVNTIDADSSKVVAEFKVLSGQKKQELSIIKSHELIKLKKSSKSNRIKLASNTVGYKVENRSIDLEKPLKGLKDSTIRVQGDTIFVDFKLSKYEKGDFAILGHVFFYKDAAIMKEESITELNQLFTLLKENDKMRIRIHGHTNGNSHGKVLHLDLDDKQFFSLSGPHNRDEGTAKQLSEYRAYTIQHWLIEEGIPEARMEVKGWGGKKMIQRKRGKKAYQNVRVEIEILDI